MKPSKALKAAAILAAFAALIFCALILFYLYRTRSYKSDTYLRDDLAAFGNTDAKYETLFISMTAPDKFSSDAFELYRGESTYMATHKFEGIYDINYYLGAISLDSLSAIYMILDPALIGEKYDFHASLYARDYLNTLLPLIKNNRGINFEILLPYYSLEYWSGLQEDSKNNILSSYRNFLNIFSGEDNVALYFLGDEEWLISNPANFEEYNSCNTSVSSTILSLSFSDEKYRLTTENMDERFNKILALCDEPKFNPIDLSGTDIVFFGDSVIGNFTDSTSIPCVVSAYSNAACYNIGIGGTSASYNDEAWCLVKIVDEFLTGNYQAFAKDQQAGYGIQDYVDKHIGGETHPIYFIINYGLNDYFGGFTINAYKQGFTESIVKLRETYPDCEIILVTPTFCSYYSNGAIPCSADGGVLSDYVNAVKEISELLNVRYIDNYNECGIDASNYGTYLPDGCHPNEAGRLLIGRHILENLAGITNEQ